MRLYHGSPKNIHILKPQYAKGRSKFENRQGVFLTRTFLHAALYALGKTLKGKAAFGVSESKLVIAGKLGPKPGYVYEVEAKNSVKGPRGQYLSREKLKPVKKTKVFPREYKSHIIWVRQIGDILKKLR